MTEAQSMPHVPLDALTFDSGAEMPLLGFGTWQIRGAEAVRATSAALEAGYRHIDTATIYGNETEVGQALNGSGLAREDVFVTTKCPPNLAGKELETLGRSLTSLGTDYVDLWLIHAPAGKRGSLSMWRAFVDARESGQARDIGVSNFDVELIDELASVTGCLPVVNQIEWSPLLFDATVLAEHRARGVALEGYSALRGGVLENPTVARIAAGLSRTPAQVVIRWHLQHGVVVIPKSRNPERIRLNADVADFELSADDMAALDALAATS